jgi:hypothetical protein
LDVDLEPMEEKIDPVEQVDKGVSAGVDFLSRLDKLRYQNTLHNGPNLGRPGGERQSLRKLLSPETMPERQILERIFSIIVLFTRPRPSPTEAENAYRTLTVGMSHLPSLLWG